MVQTIQKALNVGLLVQVLRHVLHEGELVKSKIRVQNAVSD